MKLGCVVTASKVGLKHLTAPGRNRPGWKLQCDWVLDPRFSEFLRDNHYATEAADDLSSLAIFAKSTEDINCHFIWDDCLIVAA